MVKKHVTAGMMSVSIACTWILVLCNALSSVCYAEEISSPGSPVETTSSSHPTSSPLTLSSMPPYATTVSQPQSPCTNFNECRVGKNGQSQSQKVGELTSSFTPIISKEYTRDNAFLPQNSISEEESGPFIEPGGFESKSTAPSIKSMSIAENTSRNEKAMNPVPEKPIPASFLRPLAMLPWVDITKHRNKSYTPKGFVSLSQGRDSVGLPPQFSQAGTDAFAESDSEKFSTGGQVVDTQSQTQNPLLQEFPCNQTLPLCINITVINDQHNGGDFGSGTPEFQKGNSSIPSEKTTDCFDACGLNLEKCSCTMQCLVYKNCCEDFESTCKDTANEGKRVLRRFLNSSTVCLPQMQALFIATCPPSYGSAAKLQHPSPSMPGNYQPDSFPTRPMADTEQPETVPATQPGKFSGSPEALKPLLPLQRSLLPSSGSLNMTESVNSPLSQSGHDSSSTEEEGDLSKQLESSSLPEYPQGNGSNPTEDSVIMYDTEADDVAFSPEAKDYHALCQLGYFFERADLIPVRDIKTGLDFVNTYCALCHGVEAATIEAWESRIDLSKTPSDFLAIVTDDHASQNDFAESLDNRRAFPNERNTKSESENPTDKRRNSWGTEVTGNPVHVDETKLQVGSNDAPTVLALRRRRRTTGERFTKTGLTAEMPEQTDSSNNGVYKPSYFRSSQLKQLHLKPATFQNRNNKDGNIKKRLRKTSFKPASEENFLNQLGMMTDVLNGKEYLNPKDWKEMTDTKQKDYSTKEVFHSTTQSPSDQLPSPILQADQVGPFLGAHPLDMGDKVRPDKFSLAKGRVRKPRHAGVKGEAKPVPITRTLENILSGPKAEVSIRWRPSRFEDPVLCSPRTIGTCHRDFLDTGEERICNDSTRLVLATNGNVYKNRRCMLCNCPECTVKMQFQDYITRSDLGFSLLVRRLGNNLILENHGFQSPWSTVSCQYGVLGRSRSLRPMECTLQKCSEGYRQQKDQCYPSDSFFHVHYVKVLLQFVRDPGQSETTDTNQASTPNLLPQPSMNGNVTQGSEDSADLPSVSSLGMESKLTQEQDIQEQYSKRVIQETISSMKRPGQVVFSKFSRFVRTSEWPSSSTFVVKTSELTSRDFILDSLRQALSESMRKASGSEKIGERLMACIIIGFLSHPQEGECEGFLLVVALEKNFQGKVVAEKAAATTKWRDGKLEGMPTGESELQKESSEEMHAKASSFSTGNWISRLLWVAARCVLTAYFMRVLL